MAKITVNVWDFDRLGTAVAPAKRDGFPTFATALNSFIDIIHSTENKAIMEGTTSVKKSTCPLTLPIVLTHLFV